MLIGFAGYLEPGDEYQLILPEVSSWTIDKRNKAQRKQNYQGGFSTSTTKYDESKFISLSWDTLSEVDISLVNGYDNYIEPFAISKSTTAITTNTLVNVNTYALIPNGTKVYVKRGSVYISMIASSHTATNVRLTSTTAVTITTGENLYLYNAPLGGLLSLASISATGQSHTLRDFSGKLVKALFNSPKYEAIGGSDSQGQLYFNARLDIDIVTDTSSFQYVTSKRIEGSTYNEQLPINNGVVTTPVSTSVTNLFVNGLNNVGLGFVSTNNGNSFTLEALLPYKFGMRSMGGLIDNLAKDLIFFKDYLATDTQIPKRIMHGNSYVYADNNETKLSVDIPTIPDYQMLGAWSPVVKYGTWDAVSGGAVNVPLGVVIKDNTTDQEYLSLQGGNSEPFSDTKAWANITNDPKVVRHQGKLYEMTAPSTGAEHEPHKNTGKWTALTLPPTLITVTIEPSLMAELEDKSLFVVMAPYALETDTTPALPFESASILKIPFLKEQFTHGVEFSTSSETVKTASTAYDRKKVYSTALDNSTDADLPTPLEFVEYQPYKISGLIVPANIAKTVSMSTESTSMDINQVRFADGYNVVNYTMINNDSGFNNVTLGTYAMSLNNSTVTLHFRDQASKRRVFTGFTGTVETKTEVMKLNTALDFTKALYELKYDHVTNKVTVSIYSTVLANDYKIVPIVEGKIDYDNVGFKIIRTKSTFVSTTFTDTNTSVQQLNFNYKASGYRVMYGSSNTYITKPLSDSNILKLFGLEGDSWL